MSSKRKASVPADAAAPRSGLRREFNDHMSSEGNTSGIPFIIRMMYVMLLAYSYLCSLATGDHILTQFCFYFVIIILFYAWHWLAHQNFMGKMHEIHWRHHFHSFPPKKFYGDPGVCTREYGSECPTFLQLMDPRTSTNFTIWHEGILYGLLFVALMIERFVLGYSWLTVSFSLLMSSFIGAVGSALHSSFHVRDFQFEKYDWYLELRALHYIHHLGSTQHNFGVFNIGLVDGVMNSIRLTDPVKKTETQLSLPENMSSEHFMAAHSTSGHAGRLLLFSSVHHEEEQRKLEQMSAVKRGYPTVLTRFILIGLGIWFWRAGQEFIRSYAAPLHILSDLPVDDIGHRLFDPLRSFIISSGSATALHNAQVLLSDVTVLLIILFGIFGRTVRGSLTMIVAALSRTLVQAINPFVAVPRGILQPALTVPTVLSAVAKHEASFFSPHVIAAVALLLDTSTSSRWRDRLAVPSLLLVAFQVVAALTLHTSWSIDVLFAGVLTFVSFRIGSRLASTFDGMKSL